MPYSNCGHAVSRIITSGTIGAKLLAGTCRTNLESYLSLATVALLFLTGFCPGAIADCPSPTANTPVTSSDETGTIPSSRQLVNGGGTVIDTTTPGKIKVNASAPYPLVISSYSGGAAYAPPANTFTNVTSATQINLPGTASIPVGSVIGLTIGGSQGATNVVTDGGAADENIIFNGSTTNTSIIIKKGDEIFLANAGSGSWLVTSFLPQGGSSGSTWTVLQGGTGASTVLRLLPTEAAG